LGPGLAYSRLLKLRPGPEAEQPNLLLECDLCVSWELTPDFAYEFQLRPDVRWQDIPPVSGRPLVAEDIVFSYERLRTPGWPSAHLFSSIGAIEALGPHTLRVELALADADVLMSLADGHTKIIAWEVVEQYGDLRTSPVIGTGPWMWEETTAGVGTNFRRNPDYFEDGLPFLEQLQIKAIRSSEGGLSLDQTRLAAFQGGLVDVALLPPEEWRKLDASNAEIGSVISKQAGTGVAFSMNVQAPPLDHLSVRRAILNSIDPWNYVDTLWSAQGFVSLGIPVQGPDWLLGRDEMRTQHFADPGAARELLAASGMPGPVDIELTVRTEEDSGIYLALAERIAGDLRQVGFNPRIRRLNPLQFSEAVLNHRDYELALGVLPPTSTTSSFLMGLLHSEGRWNLTGHRDRVLDAMIQQQAAEFDPDQRKTQLVEIQRYILEQAYMFTPISSGFRWVFNQDVRGFYPNTALSEYDYWSRVWLER
jgi:peptide/nickel transport system substrate-binding protein